jgi:phosphoribosylformylglycinamidine cyclo-ligase
VADTYLARGVSAAKPEVHAAIAGLDPGLFPGAFCKIVGDVAGDERFVAVMHADGAGTKAAVAYLAYREADRPEVFEGIAQDAAVMNVDDLLCVGVTERFLLSNTIGRNAHRVDGRVLEALIRGYERLAADLRPFGVELALAGGETADVGDLVATVVVDSTVFARLRRDAVVDAATIRVGDAIVGLASSGRATYEREENSGIGANGLTLARHVLLHGDYAARYPETYSPTLAPEHVYRGRFHLADRLPGSSMTVGAALLSPTRTFAPVVRQVLSRHREAVSGIVHCSGGGQTKCLRFGRGLHFVKDRLLPVPPVFRAIMEQGGVPRREMFEVFNMGHRLEIFCRPAAADGIVAIARGLGVDAQVIGEVRPNADPDANRLTIADGGDALDYALSDKT